MYYLILAPPPQPIPVKALNLILITFITFIFSGIFSLVKIRTVMKQDGGKTDKLEKLIARIGVFSILYTIPKCVIIGKT